MEILGKDFIAYKALRYVDKIEALEDGTLFYYDENFIKVAQEKKLEFSLIIRNKYEALFGNAAKAKYLLLDKRYYGKIEDLVDLAEFYLFDAKISFFCKNEKDFEQAVRTKVDCAIFEKGIIWK